MAAESSHQALQTMLLEIGTALYSEASRFRPTLFDSRGMRGRILHRAINDEALRCALFQFIDVLPQLDSAHSIAAHFRSYLKPFALAGAWGKLLKLGRSPLAAQAVRNSVVRLARLYLVEEKSTALHQVLGVLRRVPATATVDAVGETVVSDQEARAYLMRVLNLLRWLVEAGVASPNLSIKLSALTPRFDPIDAVGTRLRVFERLAPLMKEVQLSGATLTVDMEQNETKPLILHLFQELVIAFPETNWLPSIALQAYQPEAERDLLMLIQWAKAAQRRIGVRLVKGAYWDTEVALAKQRRWPVPVFQDKAETDANYERLTAVLFDHCGVVYPAIASHNVRSLAHAIALARDKGIPNSAWEIQMLYGMAEPLQQAVASLGVPLRIYLPSGELITGIAYLIRRLLENTASTSMLRLTYVEGTDIAALLAAPQPKSAPPAPSQDGFTNIPLIDFSKSESRETFSHALAKTGSQLGRAYSLTIHGASEPCQERYSAINPARPDQVLARFELAGISHAEQAVNNALLAFLSWRDTAAERRIELCLKAADLMFERRAALAAWEILEAGKNWREADADVAEAIDYLRFYAGQMAKLAGFLPTTCFPSETNHLRYEPLGVAVVISPWNFPLAILTGMTAAALVTGNCVIMKPALPALGSAHWLQEILWKAGFPPEVCQLLPGHGSVVGSFLVQHRDVHVVAFTGSREVGLAILDQAHRTKPEQTHVKRVVCEMGGKNAIIVDEDADLDEVVPQILYSAFGYQGQKCSAASRIIAVEKIHDRLVARLAAMADSFPLGPPEDPQYLFGPVISREAQQKAQAYFEIGKTEGVLHYQGEAPQNGFYFAPAIFTHIRPEHRLAREEIFAPILAVLRADDFETALDMALDSEYALTGGVFSRLPEHLELARERFRVGDLYLNRKITGALVGIQPFGGVKLSGTGVQAGGPDYLKQFMWTRMVSENTLRHGFVPFEQNGSKTSLN